MQICFKFWGYVFHDLISYFYRIKHVLTLLGADSKAAKNKRDWGVPRLSIKHKNICSQVLKCTCRLSQLKNLFNRL